jgi:hypothetical protein
MAPVVSDEAELDIECRYRPGLASLAKTRLMVEFEAAGGRRTSGQLAVPPARLGKALRFVTGGEIVRITMRLEAAGALEPFPVGVKVRSLVLVRIASR